MSNSRGCHSVNAFLRLKCAPDILAKLGPGALHHQELTEIMRTFCAVKSRLASHFGDDALLFDIGCGRRPRAAVFFAHLTKWNCVAIDPRLREDNYNTQRLTLAMSKVQDMNLLDFLIPQHRFVVAVYIHSHASVLPVVKAFNHLPLLILSLPCCVSTDIEQLEGNFWADTSVLSPKNVFYCYANSLMKPFINTMSRNSC